MEEDDIPDLLFTLEFEKSFDGVGWSFLYKHCNIYVLRIFFVFGLKPFICSCIITKM